MPSELVDLYREASLTRWRATSLDKRDEINQPGLNGLLATPKHPSVVMLVTDDRALAQLAEICRVAGTGMVQVFRTAPRSVTLLEREHGWKGSPLTAMVCRSLAKTPRAHIPAPFQLRPVRRTDDDSPAWVSLDDAVACVTRAAPGEDPEKLSEFLRSLTTTRLFAAIDADGQVRATAGYELTDGHALVLLIDTDPLYQRQGLATAMTSAALLDARRHGAHTASLDASDRGGSVYRRMGFEVAGPTIRFMR